MMAKQSRKNRFVFVATTQEYRNSNEMYRRDIIVRVSNPIYSADGHYGPNLPTTMRWYSYVNDGKWSDWEFASYITETWGLWARNDVPMNAARLYERATAYFDKNNLDSGNPQSMVKFFKSIRAVQEIFDPRSGQYVPVKDLADPKMKRYVMAGKVDPRRSVTALNPGDAVKLITQLLIDSGDIDTLGKWATEGALAVVEENVGYGSENWWLTFEDQIDIIFKENAANEEDPEYELAGE